MRSDVVISSAHIVLCCLLLLSQGPITNTPLARMLSIPDEYHLVDYRATISAVKKHLKVRNALESANTASTHHITNN